MLLTEIKKSPEGLYFDKKIDIKESLMERHSEIMDISDIQVSGHVVYEDGLYLLDYNMAYDITLPSSRSMKPVVLSEKQTINEVFIEAENVCTKKELVDQELVLILEEDDINLEESVIDNILLNIPLRVLAADEVGVEADLSGKNWSLMTEKQYEEKQAKEKEKSNPFAALEGMFDSD
ncbi:YceD family protein [Streptococcus agalactiae]